MGKAKKEKSVKKKFRIDGNNGEYNFQLKKKPNLWWLLLLLLPLVLLIPLRKDITVYTRLDGTPEPFVDVSMNYTARYLLWDKKFNVKMPYDTVQQTDSVGKTVFKRVGYSVYSFIFHFKAPVVFSAGGDDCYDSISKTCRFHTTRKVVLDMSPKLTDVRLKVVDKELGFELPGANVECDFIGKHGAQHVADTTDAAGCVVVKEARLCGEFSSIKVGADGYADTLLTQKQVAELLGQTGGYVIPLRPLKERFIFYVKNVYTKEPIPDALAEVTLTLNGKQGAVGRSRTNVDGLGQGFFDDARILATIGIKASKQGYYDSVYVAPKGKPNPITVRDFVKLDSIDRVVWLRPKPHTEQFRNVDTLTMQPIAGVRNEIIIEGVDGKTRTVVATSNRNGYFDVTALPGDKITIKSTLDPYYYPKTTEIDSFDKGEIIYMLPVLVDLTFRTIEMVDGVPLGLLPNCDLIVTVDGNRVQPVNSGNGEFTVENLHPNSVISIVASKQYYNTNNTKVNNRKVGDLMNAPQGDRDIPLGIERTCGEMFTSEASQYDSQTRIPFLHIMGKPSGRFKFMFRTRELPDELEVWNCRPEEISTADRSKCLLFKWSLTDGNGGCTPDGYYNGSPRPGLSPEMRWLDYSNGPYITVVGIRKENDSNFDYVVCCPEEDCDVDWTLGNKAQPIPIIDTSLFRPLPGPPPD